VGLTHAAPSQTGPRARREKNSRKFDRAAIMLGIFTPNGPEAMRRSAELRKAGVPHQLFGPQISEFADYLDLPRGEGQFFRVTCMEGPGEVSPDFLAPLVEQEITQIANAGTFNSIIHVLATESSFNYDWMMKQPMRIGALPSREEILFLEAEFPQARVNGAPISLHALHDFLPEVGPDSGFYGPAGKGILKESEILSAVVKARETLETFVSSEARGRRRGINRVALTVIYDSGGCTIPETTTEPRMGDFSNAASSGTPRLLMKLSHSQQSVLDPSAIGPRTIMAAKAARFDGIVMSTGGLIFDRDTTLALAEEARMPIYGID
jgi:hypothetical protein